MLCLRHPLRHDGDVRDQEGSMKLIRRKVKILGSAPFIWYHLWWTSYQFVQHSGSNNCLHITLFFFSEFKSACSFFTGSLFINNLITKYLEFKRDKCISSGTISLLMGISERSCQCCNFQQFAGLFINYSTCSLQVGVGYTYWPGTPLTRLKQQYTPFHKFYWGFHYVMIQEFPFHGLQVDSEDTLNRFMHSSLARTLVRYLN